MTAQEHIEFHSWQAAQQREATEYYKQIKTVRTQRKADWHRKKEMEHQSAIRYYERQRKKEMTSHRPS